MPHYTREITRTLETGGSPGIDVQTVHGAVTVRGEDRDNVLITATARFSVEDDDTAEALVRSIEDGIYQSSDRVFARAPEQERGTVFGVLRHVTGHGPRLKLDFDIVAPWGSALSAHIVNGSLEVRRLNGDVRLHMVNGRYQVEDLGAGLTFRHVNGHGAIRRVAGNLSMHYTNGDLELERPGRDVSLRLVNGRVEIKEPAGSVSVRGVSGSYTLSGAISGDVTMYNSHGRIRLDLPAESRFRLDAQSTLGSVSCELPVREGAGGQDAAPRVKLRSESGSIELRQLRPAEPAYA